MHSRPIQTLINCQNEITINAVTAKGIQSLSQGVIALTSTAAGRWSSRSKLANLMD